MNDKWSALVNAPVPAVASAVPTLAPEAVMGEPKQSSGIVSLATAFFFFAVTAIVVVAFVLKTNAKNRKAQRAVKTVELVTTALAEEAVAPVDPEVEPKTAVDTSDGPSAYLEANGLTFSDFQKAFGHGREKPLMDKPERNYSSVLADLEALRPALEATGETFQDYIESHHMKVPDALLELWTNASTASDHTAVTHDVAPEAMMLAREALQSLSADGPEAVAIAVLREILAARTEAARLGLKLPEAPFEQASAIRTWASRNGVAANIANTILSRF